MQPEWNIDENNGLEPNLIMAAWEMAWKTRTKAILQAEYEILELVTLLNDFALLKTFLIGTACSVFFFYH